MCIKIYATALFGRRAGLLWSDAVSVHFPPPLAIRRFPISMYLPTPLRIRKFPISMLFPPPLRIVHFGPAPGASAQHPSAPAEPPTARPGARLSGPRPGEGRPRQGGPRRGSGPAGLLGGAGGRRLRGGDGALLGGTAPNAQTKESWNGGGDAAFDVGAMLCAPSPRPGFAGLLCGTDGRRAALDGTQSPALPGRCGKADCGKAEGG